MSGYVGKSYPTVGYYPDVFRHVILGIPNANRVNQK